MQVLKLFEYWKYLLTTPLSTYDRIKAVMDYPLEALVSVLLSIAIPVLIIVLLYKVKIIK